MISEELEATGGADDARWMVYNKSPISDESNSVTDMGWEEDSVIKRNKGKASNKITWIRIAKTNGKQI